MALPTIDEFLLNLNRMRRDSLRLRDTALVERDFKGAKTLQRKADQIGRMILKKGGTVDA